MLICYVNIIFFLLIVGNESSLPYLFKLSEKGKNLKGELDDLLESINESGTNSSTAFATSTLRQV